MTRTLNWGLLACGNIARQFARGLAHSKTGRLVAVGSRTREAAERFGAEFDVAHRHGSYEALLADEDVDAVYVSTPHPMHAEWAIRAAEAGKHVLCEKPIGLNHAEAMAIVEAARRNDVFLMEAFMYRCHPQTVRLIELIRGGAIGEVRVIQATFSFHAPFDPASRIYAQALGGGGILDVGCYCTSMARLIAGVATGRDFAEPIEVRATGHIGPQSRIDEYAVASLRFTGGIVASLATGVACHQESVVRVFGTAGWLLVESPWIPSKEGGTTRILLHKPGQPTPEEIRIETPDWLYAIEADTVAANVDRRQAPGPAMTWDDTLRNMKTLDRWREAIGLVYDGEKPEAQRLPLAGRPLAVRSDASMPHGTIGGVEKRVSRLVMGVDNQTTMPHAAVMFDDFFERGGTCFDTAWIYGRDGTCERLLGQWVRSRGVRDEVVLLDKGAHTPYCDPASLARQLAESLDRLQTDGVDLYMLHRDNPQVPVGEFIDALNEHIRAGRMKAFGASNWTLDRIDAANAYAKAKGLLGFSAISNQFSLARMIEPVWAGCVSASDAASRDWLTRTQMPLMAWSSQARGFFAGRARPDDRSDAELVRCWYSDDNFARLRRAEELAAKHNVLPIQIALAYVLAQPFPTFALIGPRTIDETRSSFAALGIALTPDEVRWLDGAA